MSGDRVDVRISVEDSAAQAGFQRVRVSVAEFQATLKAAGGDAGKALSMIAGIGNVGVSVARGLATAGAAAEQLGGKVSGALRELTALQAVKTPRLGAGRANDDSIEQWAQEVDAFRRAQKETENAAEERLDAERRASDASYQRQIQQIEAEERLGKNSAAQALAQETTLLNDKWAADQAYYAKRKAAAEGDAKEQERLDDDEAAAYQANLSEQQRIADDAATHVQQAWESVLKPIDDAFATFAEQAILGTRRISASFDAMMQSLLKDVIGSTTKGLVDEIFGGSASGGAAGAGGGLGGLGVGLINSLTGDLFKGLIGNPFSSSSGGLLGGLLPLGAGAAGGGLLASLFGDGAGLGNTATDFSSAFGGLGFGGLFTGIGTLFRGLFGFGRGGLVPSAAGGWVVPHFADGGILSVLHQNEMVLPAPISQGLQHMIAAGGVPGGHTININAIDGLSVARLLRSNGSALVAALNSAIRNGSMLAQPS
jgi:hypothetical protein